MSLPGYPCLCEKISTVNKPDLGGGEHVFPHDLMKIAMVSLGGLSSTPAISQAQANLETWVPYLRAPLVSSPVRSYTRPPGLISFVKAGNSGLSACLCL